MTLGSASGLAGGLKFMAPNASGSIITFVQGGTTGKILAQLGQEYGALNGHLILGSGTATSTLEPDSFILAQGASYNFGKFYVDTSGNVSATGTLAAFGATSLNGAVTLGDAVNDNITVSGRLAGTINISDGSTATTSLTYNTFKSGVLTGTYDVGKFYIDSSGNVSASGTLAVFGNTTLGDSDLAGGDTLRVYGSLAMGATPTGNAQLYINASSTKAVPLIIKGHSGALSSEVDDYFVIKDNNDDIFFNVSTSTLSLVLPDSTTRNFAQAAAMTLGAADSVRSGFLLLDQSGVLAIGGSGSSDGITQTWLGDDVLMIGSDNLLTTSTLTSNSFKLGTTDGYNVGKFYVDSSGNVSASGTLRAIIAEDVGATCQIGDIRFDTGGVTKELCYCSAANTWGCVSMTTITGPTD